MYDFLDLIYTELYNVAVCPGLTYLSVGVRSVLDLQPVHFLGIYSLDRIGLAAEFGYRYKLYYVSLY
jgi:hypothetical protein